MLSSMVAVAASRNSRESILFLAGIRQGHNCVSGKIIQDSKQEGQCKCSMNSAPGVSVRCKLCKCGASVALVLCKWYPSRRHFTIYQASQPRAP